MSRAFLRRLPVALTGLMLGACLGCGTGEYTSRLRDAEIEIRQGSDFAKNLRPPITLGDTPVKIQLPKEFAESPLAAGTDSKRRELPLENVPIIGLKATYEGFVKDSEGGKLPYYCYLAINDATTTAGKRAAAALHRRLGETFPESTEPRWPRPWPTMEFETPDGQSRQWGKITSAGRQMFLYVDKDGKEKYISLHGLFEFYIGEEGDFQVIIGWRLPDSIKKHVKVSQWARWMGGSVRSR